nr:MAG TPA: hypothetical protein [Caudoviricetes sp.]
MFRFDDAYYQRDRILLQPEVPLLFLLYKISTNPSLIMFIALNV